MAFRYTALENSIVEAVRRGVEGRDVGVAFSGGLDSGLAAAIAMRYARSVTLYTCGTENAYDVVKARDLAARLGLPWVHARLTKGNVEDRIRGLCADTGTTDPFTISYELQLYCVCLTATEDCILTGQGADEYFMGCMKFVDRGREDLDVLADAAVERLMTVSVPCERRIAAHFGKDLVYPYLDDGVVAEVGRLDPEDLVPKDPDSRKSVLREIALDLGQQCIAERKKKSSQYGSGTTDLIRGLAKAKGMMYNQYIASLCDETCGRTVNRGSVINARIDPLVKIEAERILGEIGSDPSEAVELLYRRIIEDRSLKSVAGEKQGRRGPMI